MSIQAGLRAKGSGHQQPHEAADGEQRTRSQTCGPCQMDDLDPRRQMQPQDPSHPGANGGHGFDHRSQASPYPQTYTDPSLLHFPGAEHALASPPLPFSPSDPQALQYALTANALVSADQHQQRSKKEIKRRTKTGCLTCRKRRIKCDEAQPACNNCRKSKRECQGYDPLFKAQQTTAAIQPAANELKSPTVTQPLSSTHAPYSGPPAGYAAVQSPGYSVASMAQAPSESSTFDFSVAIDPALQAQGASMPEHASAQDSLFNPLASIQEPHHVELRPSSIDELLPVGGPYPDAYDTQLTDDKKQEIKELFNYYATGLNKFLETQWIQQHGAPHLLKNQALMQKYALLLSRMQYTADRNPFENTVNLTIEAHMIWGSLDLARLAADEAKLQATATAAEGGSSHGEVMAKRPGDTNTHIDAHETALRLGLLQTLITNTHLDPAQLESLSKCDEIVPQGMNNLHKQLLARERKFWKNTAKFLTLNPDIESAETIDAALQDIRGLLESKENRDIMYSVAVMRIWPRRLQERESRARASGDSNPQLDKGDLQKVEVAKTFLTQQAGGRGTTVASQRICGMVLRGWHPLPFSV